MLLTIGERLELASMLPGEGNFLLMKRRRELIEALTHFTDEERAEYGFELNEETGQLRWSPEAAAKEFNIPIGEFMQDTIRKRLKDWDEKEKLQDAHISLYEKFVEQTA